jgi:hypothetical protein
MHGNQHLGVSDEEAMDRFITILSTGLWQGAAKDTRKKGC